MRRTMVILFCLAYLQASFGADVRYFGVHLKHVKSVSELEGEPLIFFEGDWASALLKANQEQKFIFLDAYTSWCKPCKLMELNTFTDKAVAEFFNANFINFKMDMEKNEHGERLAKKYSLAAYPSFFIVDKEEKLIDYEIGFLKPRQLIAFGKRGLQK